MSGLEIECFHAGKWLRWWQILLADGLIKIEVSFIYHCFGLKSRLWFLYISGVDTKWFPWLLWELILTFQTKGGWVTSLQNRDYFIFTMYQKHHKNCHCHCHCHCRRNKSWFPVHFALVAKQLCVFKLLLSLWDWTSDFCASKSSPWPQD